MGSNGDVEDEGESKASAPAKNPAWEEYAKKALVEEGDSELIEVCAMAEASEYIFASGLPKACSNELPALA